MKKIIWQKLWARKYSPFGMAGYIMGLTDNPLFSKCLNKLALPEGKLSACYFSKQEFQKLSQRYLNQLMKTKNLLTYAREFENKFRLFYLWVEKFSRQDFARLSNQELAVRMERMYRWYIECGDWQLIIWPVVFGPMAELERRFSGQPNGDRILGIIGTPYKMTRTMAARQEFLKLAASKPKKKQIEEYAKKFAWIPVYEIIDRPWQYEDFVHQLIAIKNPLVELSRLRQERRRKLSDYEKFFNKIKDRKLKKLVEICHVFVYLKEMRDDYRRPAFYLLRGFWQEIAKRTGLTFEQTNYLIKEELVKILNTGQKPDLKEICSRQKRYGLILKNGKLKIYSGQEVDQIINLVPVNQDNLGIRGMGASPSRTLGEVSVVYHQDDFKKFKKGQILVTVMTHPEFVPIMKMAKAVITDEGGITCHAAIACRELKIPCVIGTGNATKMLKDGDMVEVDADKGVVKILTEINRK